MVLALGLPPQTFFAGDPGVKLIAARHAIAQPGRPFQIPLPEIAGEPAPFVDRFFLVHDDHSHAVTPELFPLLSAPFIAVLGLRGAYVLPAAGLLLAIAATAWLGLLLDRRRSPVTLLLTAFLGTPLLFYGLEFWEHAPAAGVAMLAAALLVRSASLSSSYGQFAGVGLLFGIAALLRPEALWFGVAVLAGSLLLRSRPSAGRLGAATAGMLLPLLLLELYTLAHFGHALPPHIAGNPGLLGGDWFADAAHRVLVVVHLARPEQLLACRPGRAAGVRLAAHVLLWCGRAPGAQVPARRRRALCPAGRSDGAE